MWSKHFSSKRGHHYFVNNETGESVWEQPDGYISSDENPEKKMRLSADLPSTSTAHQEVTIKSESISSTAPLSTSSASASSSSIKSESKELSASSSIFHAESKDLGTAAASSIQAESKELPRKAGPGIPHLTSASIQSGESFNMIGHTLLALCTAINGSPVPKTQIEIEVRVGMIVQDDMRWRPLATTDSVQHIDRTHSSPTEFKSGVDESFYIDAKALLNDPSRFTQTTQPTQCLYFDASDNRWLKNEDGSIRSGEKKTRIMAIDLAYLGREYDIRIAAASEIIVPSPLMPPVLERARVKNRTTYIPINGSAWQIDVTDVETGTIDPRTKQFIPNAAGRSLEIEFEIQHGALQRLLSISDDTALRSQLVKIAEELARLIDVVSPFHQENPAESVIVALEKADGVYLGERVSALTAKIRGANAGGRRRPGASGDSGLDFIGSMPINMHRGDLSRLQRRPYFVTEKSDGQRYLLYCVENRTGSAVAVLVNREGNLHGIVGGNVVGAALGVGTVLDGELVYNRSLKKQVFLMFDILSDTAVVTAGLIFSQRLDIINHGVAERCRQYQQQIRPDSLSPLLLVRKIFHPKLEISELLAKISCDHGEKVYFDSERRHHKTDGVILQPDTPYVFNTDPGLLKWKWTDMRSVDLKVDVSELEYGRKRDDHSKFSGSGMEVGSRKYVVQLSSESKDGEMIDCSRGTSMGYFDTLRLIAEHDHHSKVSRNPLIVEVSYRSDLSQWCFLHVRKDKTTPNRILTVMGVLMEQAENVSIEELEYSLLATTSSELSYAEDVRRLIPALLEQRRQARLQEKK